MLKISDIGNVIHGVTLSRVEPKPLEEKVTYSLFTIQELNEELSKFSVEFCEKTVEVSKEKFDKTYLAKENMVIIGLNSLKSIAVNQKIAGKVIPSNFAFIELDTHKVNPNYFAWYFNEHPDVERQLKIAMQGTILRALSVQMLRELDIILPPINVQKKIGRIYTLQKKKEKLLYEKSILEERLYKGIIMEKLKQYKK